MVEPITSVGFVIIIFITSLIVGIRILIPRIKSDYSNVKEDRKNWKNIDNQIEFRKYMYNQVFVLVFGLIAIILFFLSLFFDNFDKSIPFYGWLSMIILAIEIAYLIYWFTGYIIKANNFTISEMNYLYKEKDKGNKK